MVKLAKKKADMQVRDKILTLLDSWQEAFGGPGEKHPQYYWAFFELKQYGLEFPKRAPAQPGHGMPANSSLRLDAAISSDGHSLSSSDLERMLGAVELLSEMLKAVNPNDHQAAYDDIITELVDQCRSYNEKIMSRVSSVRDEELLGQALDLNDKLQILLAKYDALVSGYPLPAEERDVLNELPEGSTTTPAANPQVTVALTIVPANIFNDEEEDDEFSQLARRNSKFRSATSSGVGTSLSSTQDGIASSVASVTSTASPSVPCNALALPDPPAPVSTSPEEQIMSELLALTISSTPSPPYTPLTPESAMTQGASLASDHPQPHGNPAPAAAPPPYSSYVAPWAQLHPPTTAIQQQPPPESQVPYNSSAYPPPPWASQDKAESNPFIAASSQHGSNSNSTTKAPLNLRPLQQSQSFGVPLRSAGSESPINQGLKQPMSAGARRPSYVSSNKFFDNLFERNADGSVRMGNTVGDGSSSPYKP